MSTERIIETVAEVFAADWWTFAPKYRTGLRLQQHIAEAIRKAFEAAEKERTNVK